MLNENNAAKKYKDARVKIFLSYARHDNSLKKDLMVHLSPLEKSFPTQIWQNAHLEAGEEWLPAIIDKLEAAHIILLLISPHFINSDFCHSVEMKRVLERHATKKAVVIPILLRPCDWKDLAFKKLRVLPMGTKPVSKWGENKDSAYIEIGKAVKKVVQRLLSS